MEKIIFENTTWINIENVTREDTEVLREQFKFHPLDLKDCLGAPQRPKVDIYDEYFFLVLHFPFLDKEHNVLTTPDLDIFLTKTHIITVQKAPIGNLHEIFEEMRENKVTYTKMLQKPPDLFLYHILDKMYHFSLSIIDELDKHISETEAHMYQDKTREAVKGLASARRNNLLVRGVINPQRMVVNTLAHMQKDWFNKEGEVTLYYDDILDYLEKNWILLETQKELIDGLYETNESLMSYKTTSVITVLTIMSVSMLPLTFVTGFYGMNIPLPHANEPELIWAILLFVGLLTLLVVLYVTRKKWV